MQFTTSTILAAILSLSAFVAPSLADSVSVSFDTIYDDAGASLNTVACSDGAHGLVDKFPTFGSLPSFPGIGGAPAIAGWDSPNCGTCWQLTFNGKTVNILAIDVGLDGFNISEEAMNELTNGQAVELGRVTADVVQVASSVCGL